MARPRVRMNARGFYKQENKKPCVYRYTDLSDGIVKYIGVVKKEPLEKRIMQHSYADEWCKGKRWKIEYFECETQSEVEAFEAHLIELHETWKYYNKVKAHWGINRFLPDVEKWWKVFSSSPFADTETGNFVMNIRILIRAGEIEKAKELLNMIDFIYD